MSDICSIDVMPGFGLILAFAEIPDIIVGLVEAFIALEWTSPLDLPELIFAQLGDLGLPPMHIPGFVEIDFDVEIDINMDLAIQFGQIVFALFIDVPIGIIKGLVGLTGPIVNIPEFIASILVPFMLPDAAINIATCAADLL